MSERANFFRTLASIGRAPHVYVPSVRRCEKSRGSAQTLIDDQQITPAAALVGDILRFVQKKGLFCTHDMGVLLGDVMSGKCDHFFLPGKESEDRLMRRLRGLNIDLDDKIRSGAYVNPAFRKTE